MIRRALAWALGLVMLVLGAWTAGRREGRSAAKSEAMREDMDNARRIEDAADAARRAGGDAVDELQRAGRLRD